MNLVDQGTPKAVSQEKHSMPSQDSTTTDQHEGGAAPAAGATASDKTEQAASVSPHLKILGDDTEASEIQLRKRTTTVGRSRQCDISLSNQSVSRHHAVISRGDGQFTIEDCGSTSGTSVNGHTIKKQALKHGDNIQIGSCLLQFRTKHVPAGADEVVAKAKSLLRGKFCVVSSNMRLRFRTLALKGLPGLDGGETMQVGQGGLLIPLSEPPGDDTYLELEMTISPRLSRQIFGEIVGVIETKGTHWMCVKLHNLPKKQQDVLTASSKAGPWTSALPT